MITSGTTHTTKYGITRFKFKLETEGGSDCKTNQTGLCQPMSAPSPTIKLISRTD